MSLSHHLIQCHEGSQNWHCCHSPAHSHYLENVNNYSCTLGYQAKVQWGLDPLHRGPLLALPSQGRSYAIAESPGPLLMFCRLTVK